MKKFSLTDRFRIPTYDKPTHMQTGDLYFNAAKCKQCAICIRVCPGGCIITDTVTKNDVMDDLKKGVKSGVPRVDALKTGVTLCVACYDCGAACPHNAITIKKNFDPKFFYKRLTQASELTFPKNY